MCNAIARSNTRLQWPSSYGLPPKKKIAETSKPLNVQDCSVQIRIQSVVICTFLSDSAYDFVSYILRWNDVFHATAFWVM